MPIKGSSLKNGDRYNIIDRKFYDDFVKATKGHNISYKEFSTVINLSNELIRRSVLTNNQGFKLPEALGYLAVTRYKAKLGMRMVDWKKSKEAGTRVYHTNFHSFGYKSRIQWYMDSLAKCKFIKVYKFIPERLFQRSLAQEIYKGKLYNELTPGYFRGRKLRANKQIEDGI